MSSDDAVLSISGHPFSARSSNFLELYFRIVAQFELDIYFQSLVVRRQFRMLLRRLRYKCKRKPHLYLTL